MTIPATMQALGHLAPAANLGKSTVNTKVLSEGIMASFAVLAFRGKVWAIKYRGGETQLLMPPRVPGGPQDTAQPNVDIIVINSSPTISKIWYEKGYVEGSTEAPDCFSTNGTTPDSTSAKKQNDLCATCPKNQWGSKMTEAGKPGKACQDSKRLAVVPAGDIENVMFGGPMLLRVPPASLKDMVMFNDMLEQHGHTFFSVKTQLGFDHQVAYPKLVFTPIEALSQEQVDRIIELQTDPRTIRILNEEGTAGPAAGPVPGQQALPAPVPAAAVGLPVTPAQAAPAVYVPAAPATSAAPAPAVSTSTGLAHVQDAYDPGPIPAGLVRTPVASHAPMPVTPAAQAPVVHAPPAAAVAETAPPAPVQQAAPTPAPFKVLSPEEMAALSPEAMLPYMTALSQHFAAQTAINAPATTRRRGRPAATVAVPPPSPTPTLAPITEAAAPVTAPAGNPFGGGAPIVAPIAAPVVDPAQGQDPAIDSLNAKLGALLGG